VQSQANNRLYESHTRAQSLTETEDQMSTFRHAPMQSHPRSFHDVWFRRTNAMNTLVHMRVQLTKQLHSP
jgi:hypothetical protein